jgi:flagellin
MPQIINTNVMSLNSQRNLNRSQDAMATALQRLSSGLRINSAKDDAAGLAIGERFTAQIRGLNQAARNAADGVSLAQTAEGAMSEIANNLQRMRELAVQAANSTNSTSDRVSLNSELSSIQSEIGRVISATEFNGVQVIGASGVSLQFQVGANFSASVNTVKLSTVNLASSAGAAAGLTGIAYALSNAFGTSAGTSAGGYSGGIAITSYSAALGAVKALDVAIDRVAELRAKFGTTQNRFESIVRSVQTTSENLQASRSRIMDADFASETAELTRTQILQQAGTAMLAQANALPQNVLSLLR